jgi:hypothetical protein
MFEPWPEIREVRLQNIFLQAIQTVDIDAVPLQDERGCYIYDETGRKIYAD